MPASSNLLRLQPEPQLPAISPHQLSWARSIRPPREFARFKAASQAMYQAAFAMAAPAFFAVHARNDPIIDRNPRLPSALVHQRTSKFAKQRPAPCVLPPLRAAPLRACAIKPSSCRSSILARTVSRRLENSSCGNDSQIVMGCPM